MTPNGVASEIRNLTAMLIAVGMSIDQNFPSCRDIRGGKIVGFVGEDELSITLRNVHYAEAYDVLRKARSFNVLLPDGGMLQFLYYFSKSALIKHRLSFLPSPDLVEFQNDPELYDNDERYADITHKGVVTSPVRFDYDIASFIELHHPMSHLTIGQYKHCRIPVSGPLTPAAFCSFILRSFYNTPFRNLLADLPTPVNSFASTITTPERSVPHFNVHG